MKKIEIKIKKSFYVDVDDAEGKKCKCTLYFELPINENEEVLGLLIDRTQFLLESSLSCKWGNWFGVGKGSTILSAVTWKELNKKVDEKIKDSVNLLKKIKDENTKLLNTKPKDVSTNVEI